MMMMKATLAVILSAAVGIQGVAVSDETTASLRRELQYNNNNNYYYGNNNNNNYGGFENYEEYMRFQMAQRSFTFTGCSTVTSAYGWKSVYVTFRLCDNDTCQPNRQMGCDNANGDYIVSMAEFGETFAEYWEQMTYQDRNAAPFTCAKLDEYAQAQLNAQYNQNYNGGGNANGQNQNQNQNQNQQQWYNNNNVEYFVGPVCTGGNKIETGLFYDEDCTNAVEGTSVQDVLGFAPTTNEQQPPVCVACMQTNYYNNNGGGGGQGELNPLCDRMLEDSGRCDRTRKETSYDQYWQNNMQQGGGGGGQNRYNYGNACALIDSLPHMKAINRRTTATRAIIWSVVGVSVVVVALWAHKKGYFSGLERVKGVKLVWQKKGGAQETKYAGSDYHRETDSASMT